MLADELWEKYLTIIMGGVGPIRKDAFTAALKEYGEAVREKAVKECMDKADFFGKMPDDWLQPLHKRVRESYVDCADAIKKMELP